MRIIVDAMGGDNAPNEIIKGALDGAERYGASLTFTGDREKIIAAANEMELSLDGVEIVHTPVYITMEDDPLSVVRSKKDSSMSVGLRLLRDGADAFVSAGNTGALHTGSSLIVRSIPGIQRAAIATILPFSPPVLLLDSGANVNVTAEYLLAWARIGSLYMNKIFKIPSPRVGLLNNGAEEHKGTQIELDAYKLLRDAGDINFIGNVEGNQIPASPCDVLVTDGFTGNVTLKLVEGMGKFVFSTLKVLYSKNTVTKLSFLAMKEQLRTLKHDLDASEHGGAPLLGLKKPVIKAHGGSDARAMRNAIRQAVAYVDSVIIAEMQEKYNEAR